MVLNKRIILTRSIVGYVLGKYANSRKITLKSIHRLHKLVVPLRLINTA